MKASMQARRRRTDECRSPRARSDRSKSRGAAFKGEKAVLLVWSLRGSDHTFQLWQLPQLTTPSVLVRGEASPGSRRCHHRVIITKNSDETVVYEGFRKNRRTPTARFAPGSSNGPWPWIWSRGPVMIINRWSLCALSYKILHSVPSQRTVMWQLWPPNNLYIYI
jgi:hypothetical protein